MKTPEVTGPPRLAEWLVRFAVARSRYAEQLLGDLHEGFAGAAAQSPTAASRWYWRRALSITVHFLPSRLRASRDINAAPTGDPGMTTLLNDLRFGFRASVRLDVPHDDVNAITPKCMGILDHRVSLADPRGGADVDAEPGALIRLDLGEYLFAGWSASVLHGFILARRLSSDGALYELFMLFWPTV